MKKLFDLKEWLTLEDTAKHLTILFGEEVKVSDVLRLALDGHLQLSVNFLEDTRVNYGAVVPFKDALWNEKKIDEYVSVVTMRSTKLNNTHAIRQEAKISSINNIWDLAMILGGRLIIENMFYKLTLDDAINFRDDYPLPFDNEIFIIDENQLIACCLMELRRDFFKIDLGTSLSVQLKDRKNYSVKDNLPNDCLLIVRTNALRQLEDTIRDNQKKNDPPIRKSAATKATDTYLVIIAALAKKAGINIHEAGAANKIRCELDLLGIPMSEGTIYTKVVEVLPEVLADIPDAIGRKQKTTPKQ